MLRDWPVSIVLAGEGPTYLRLARSISDAIRDGRLRPGQCLPGSRALAASLGVHRNTVLAALRELEAEGWLTPRPARGTYVTDDLPDPHPRPLRAPAPPRKPPGPGFDLRGPRPNAAAQRHLDGVLAALGRPAGAPRLLQLVGGLPDLRLAPAVALGRAYRRALSITPNVLGYGDPRGDPRLRAALAAMLAQVRGLPLEPDDLVVTRGSQMALSLAARAILAPGDAVAVEAMGYRPAWEALRLAGARLVGVPVDGEGLRTEALEALAARTRLRAVYVTPHHQYPTTALLSPGRRMHLLDLARRHRFAVLEDDYDHEFHYESQPVLPLASADAHGSVLYVGTLSKVLAPGVRVGFVAGPAAVLGRITALRYFTDRQGDLGVERALAELLEDGTLARHVRTMRGVYRTRRDALVASLERHLPEVLRYEVPRGGLALWAEAPGVDIEAWQTRAEAAAVVVHTARRFALDGRARPALRLGYAPLDATELDEAVRRLAQTLPLPGRRKSRAGRRGPQTQTP